MVEDDAAAAAALVVDDVALRAVITRHITGVYTVPLSSLPKRAAAKRKKEPATRRRKLCHLAGVTSPQLKLFLNGMYSDRVAAVRAVRAKLRRWSQTLGQPSSRGGKGGGGGLLTCPSFQIIR